MSKPVGSKRSEPKVSKVRGTKKAPKPRVVSDKPLDQIYSMLRRKKPAPWKGKRVLTDLTVDPVELARKAEKIENDKTGRRGRNLFRAFPWIGR